jgi:hypothetical protein
MDRIDRIKARMNDESETALSSFILLPYPVYPVHPV